MDIVDTLQTLYDAAKVDVVTKGDALVVLAYGEALLKRRKQRIDEALMQREEQENEIRIALAMRAPVRFGWLVDGKKQVSAPKLALPDVEISGSLVTRVALAGAVA